MKFEEIIKTTNNDKRYILTHKDLYEIVSKINYATLLAKGQEYARVANRVSGGQPVTLYELMILVTECGIGDLILESDYTEVTCVDFTTALKQGGEYTVDHPFLDEYREERTWGFFESQYIEECVTDVANNKPLVIEDLLEGVIWLLNNDKLLRQVLLEANFMQKKE